MLTLFTVVRVYAECNPAENAVLYIVISLMETPLSILLCYIVWNQACSQDQLKDYVCFIEQSEDGSTSLVCRLKDQEPSLLEMCVDMDESMECEEVAEDS